MKILNNQTEENSQPSKAMDLNVTDFSSLIKDYGTPATIVDNVDKTINPSGDKNGSSIGKVENSQTQNSNTNWQGNPEYYQSGKKAGQKKPQRAKVVYTASNQPATISGDLISGAMFLALINLLLPSLIVAIHNYLTKEKSLHLKWSDVKISQEQENKLAPIAEMAVKQIILTWSPTAIFFISMFSLFAMNLAIARMNKDLELKAKKNA